MSGKTHFGPELFQFLAELRENNNRAWFQANRDRYVSDVREPLLAFVAEFASRLHNISAHYLADPRPSGGSMFRIYRDVRFSRDKSPYKTHAAVHFQHEVGKEVHGPGFYLHLAPEEVLAGAGMWQPDSRTLGMVRDAMSANPTRWRRLVSDDGYAGRIRLEGESLKRPPKGYDANHPLIEDLKRKDYLVSMPFGQEDACAPDFMDRYTDLCRQAAPLMEFLTKAVGLPW